MVAEASPAPARSDRRWVIGFAMLVMLVTTLPYLLGYWGQGESYRFTGFVFGVDDGNSYIAKMLSGSLGAWVFRTPYTTMPQGGIVIFLPYLLLGKLAAPPGLHDQLVAIFQLFRIASGFALVFAVNDFLAYFIDEDRLRRWCLAVIILGGGLGWVLLLLGRSDVYGSLPLEFYSPETFGFLALYGLPHLALARALMLWTLLQYLKIAGAPDTTRPRAYLILAALWLGAGLVQPLAAAIVAGVIGLHLLAILLWNVWQSRKHPAGPAPGWRAWRSALVAALVSGWPAGLFLIYNLLAVKQDAYLSNWEGQNTILSPHPVHYLLAYGLLLPFAWMGARHLLARKPEHTFLLVPWVVVFPLLAYAPLNLQRRLPDGVYVPLVLLAGVGLWNWASAGASRQDSWRGRVWSIPLWLTLPSALLLVAGGCMLVLRPGQPAFRPTQEVQAFQYLTQVAQPGAVVLSVYQTGNALPAWAPLRVVFGHGPETADFANLQQKVAAFYAAETPAAQRHALLENQQVEYVWWGPLEKAQGDWDARQDPSLREIYHQDGYAIFEVIR